MYKRSLLIQVLLIVGLMAVVIPSLVYGQSRGTGTEGAGYHSGSAATGHYGTSGSTETSRNKPQDSPTLTTGDDQEVNERIRQALRADEGLAPYAEGIYIGAEEGQIMLRGPVKTEKDKADISAAARSVAGAREINNQLQVAPNLGGTTGSNVSP